MGSPSLFFDFFALRSDSESAELGTIELVFRDFCNFRRDKDARAISNTLFERNGLGLRSATFCGVLLRRVGAFAQRFWRGSPGGMRQETRLSAITGILGPSLNI